MVQRVAAGQRSALVFEDRRETFEAVAAAVDAAALAEAGKQVAEPGARSLGAASAADIRPASTSTSAVRRAAANSRARAAVNAQLASPSGSSKPGAQRAAVVQTARAIAWTVGWSASARRILASSRCIPPIDRRLILGTSQCRADTLAITTPPRR